MKLYLVRHGKARKGGKDRLRPLTRVGVEEMEAMAGLLRRMRVRVGAIWHSDRVRAIETAKILAKVVRGKMIEREGMGPEDGIGPILRGISQAREDLIIVGHLPHLGRVVSRLVRGSASGEVVRFKTGGVTVLERQGNGRWLIDWALPPEVAGGFGS